MSKDDNVIDLSMVMDRLETGVVLLDRARRIIFCNRWFEERSGMDARTLIGMPFITIFPETENSRLEQAISHAIDDHLPSLLSAALHGTLLPLHQNEEDRQLSRRMHQMTHVIPIDSNAGGCLIQISDMTASISRERLLRQQTESLRRTNQLDPLTGVINRRCFDETLADACQTAIKTNRTLGLMIIDIDLFNPYNTHYGRNLGDARLVDIASTLHSQIRPNDTVARYGGDEFALILPDIRVGEMRLLAEKLRKSVEALPHDDDQELPLTVSIGATALLPGGESDPHTLLSSADVALYQAKHEGRNKAIYFSLEDGSFRTCVSDAPT